MTDILINNLALVNSIQQLTCFSLKSLISKIHVNLYYFLDENVEIHLSQKLVKHRFEIQTLKLIINFKVGLNRNLTEIIVPWMNPYNSHLYIKSFENVVFKFSCVIPEIQMTRVRIIGFLLYFHKRIQKQFISQLLQSN